MPTEKKGKAKVDIKIETQDSHPLSHYVDDRVELIRQIFMSLKSKTIKSIAPDFLQGKSLETIQEYCLDELLGISSKRLKSIINATKCPENTDSSDSDVENIEEHISLEEISSDSADDAQHAKKPKAKSKAPENKNKNGTAETTGTGKKEMSVLELLELQARARAIRSQLALEPVTKIELDSDNDSDASSSPTTAPSTGATTSDKHQTSKSSSSSTTVVQENNGMQIIKPNVPKVKPVRLKRNFRQRQNDDYDPDDDDETKSMGEGESKEIDKKPEDEKHDKVDKSPESSKVNESKKDEVERSPSPDLIPIIQEPETYCISSDSDEGSSSVPKYITYPTVVKENLPETEDEKFLKKIKEGTGADLRDLIKARMEGGKNLENNTENASGKDVSTIANTEMSSRREDSLASTCDRNLLAENLNEEIPASQTKPEIEKDTEPEEGELTDGDDQDVIEANQITILSSDDEQDEKTVRNENVLDDELVPRAGSDDGKNKQDDSATASSSSDSDSDSDSSDAHSSKEADDDDDIIDLGKDEELDFEVEQIDSKTKKSKRNKKKLKIVQQSSDDVPNKPEEDVHIIEDPKDNEKEDEDSEITKASTKAIEEVNASESNKKELAATDTEIVFEVVTETPSEVVIEGVTVGEGDQIESDTWQTRWLRGRNVTKVMATSRLANKVRTKIKQKKSKSEQEIVNPDSPDATSASTSIAAASTLPIITAEEGSVQHYEELVAQETDDKKE